MEGSGPESPLEDDKPTNLSPLGCTARAGRPAAAVAAIIPAGVVWENKQCSAVQWNGRHAASRACTW